MSSRHRYEIIDDLIQLLSADTTMETALKDMPACDAMGKAWLANAVEAHRLLLELIEKTVPSGIDLDERLVEMAALIDPGGSFFRFMRRSRLGILIADSAPALAVMHSLSLRKPFEMS